MLELRVTEPPIAKSTPGMPDEVSTTLAGASVTRVSGVTAAATAYSVNMQFGMLSTYRSSHILFVVPLSFYDCFLWRVRFVDRYRAEHWPMYRYR